LVQTCSDFVGSRIETLLNSQRVPAKSVYCASRRAPFMPPKRKASPDASGRRAPAAKVAKGAKVCARRNGNVCHRPPFWLVLPADCAVFIVYKQDAAVVPDDVTPAATQRTDAGKGKGFAGLLAGIMGTKKAQETEEEDADGDGALPGAGRDVGDVGCGAPCAGVAERRAEAWLLSDLPGGFSALHALGLRLTRTRERAARERHHFACFSSPRCGGKHAARAGADPWLVFLPPGVACEATQQRGPPSSTFRRVAYG
jgi:hypothetical protein